MPLKMIQKEIEAEREIGYKYLQVLARAEALVPGAGREAIDVLLWDANAAVIHADVQNDRVVLDGTLNCQAVYRQGEETSLRALSAKSTISQVTEIPGAQGGMLSRVLPVVESVEARYENGHMVFLVGLGIHVRVLKLENIRIGKQTRLQANRAANCDEHNGERMLDAAQKQAEAIRQISLKQGLFTLPPALRELARLRLENPDLSLKELGEMLDPPVGKSGPRSVSVSAQSGFFKKAAVVLHTSPRLNPQSMDAMPTAMP